MGRLYKYRCMKPTTHVTQPDFRLLKTWVANFATQISTQLRNGGQTAFIVSVKW